MIRRMRMLLVAAGMEILAACSTNESAGSTFETENSVAKIVVTNADGIPLAQSVVSIREQNYLPYLYLDSALGEYDSFDNALGMETDGSGVVRLDSIGAGDYIVEARDGDGADLLLGATRFTIPEAISDSAISVPVVLEEPATLSGFIQTEKSPVFIKIRGTHYWALVDSLGHFSFPQVPQGNFEIVAVYEDEVLIAEPVKIQKENEDLFWEDPDLPKKDTSVQLHSYLFEDFEDSTAGWYVSNSLYATAHLETDSAGLGRSGLVAHFANQNDSALTWALMGRHIGETDLSEIDSVTFWIRGNIEGKIYFSFDVIADSSVSYDSGKAWKSFEIDSVWTRLVVTPETLIKADSIGENIGWDAVKNHVTNISIFGGSSGEFWVDDIVFYGVDSTAFRFVE